MATVKKAKTAFLFFQSDNLAKIKRELGVSMGDAMTELSARWKNLSVEEKCLYFQKEREDRARFDAASREADERQLKEQEERRKNLTLDLNATADDGRSVHAQRGARARLDSERSEKERMRKKRQNEIEANLDPEILEERRRAKEKKRRETEERQRERAEKEAAMAKQHTKLDKEQAKKATNRLEYLLKQSSIFGKLKMGGEGHHKTGAEREVHHRPPAEGDARGEEEEEEVEAEQETHTFLTKQPSTIKSGKLKEYQLESLNWMIHLAEKGLNGILADEMGLGKTLQSIAVLAYHYEFLNIQGPHLICVPKSTLSNWMNELNRWCPALRAIRFHGPKEEREYMIENYFTAAAAAHDGKRPDKQIMDEHGEMIDDNTDNPRTWDVCVTTYEVCNTERKVLQKFAWKYLVIDEAHRLKNDASMFSSTVRTFRTANRLLLTGTPLQNNLHELWALLNFLLPDIFASSEQFDEWFNLEIDDEEAKKEMISQLHKVLRPFMLRRLKADVAKGLPPKTETIIMVGMSKMQKQLYKKLLLRDLDSITHNGNKNRTAVLNIVMQLRKCCGHPYLFEGVEDRTLDPLGDHLVDNCGKLSMVDKLLKRLKERGSRVLIFTQMTRVLDILEDFMVMRGYKYCRIDGNTVHEDRENSIDEFNAPGSDIFCFILSTRAGGLGINLQTADTCILYDSDWNPQQDLQAQDRCHRLGQTKPVNVYRLVCENTVEEKIVERAQQKLKLDAMVVQQGRLKDKDKVTKEEIMAAVRFGADSVFRSEESTITDDDIDIILERGAAKTKALAEKIQKAEKGDLLDFRLDGGISAQTFEGVDYSDKQLRDHLRMLAANSIGKRERRPPPTSYNPIILSKKSMVVNNQRIKLPSNLRLPPMEDHHFYNRERLLELGRLEFETYATLRELNQLPPKEYIAKQRTLLPPELAEEKIELLDEGFGDWTRSQYYHFVKACAKFGRDDIASIAADMDMPEDAVRGYGEAFWKYGPTELKNEWERVVANIDRGEKKIEKRKKLSSLLSKFIATFDNPRDEMVFANKGTTFFSLEQDKAIILAVEKHGYGNWDSVREELRNDERLKFQHAVQGMTTLSIAKRCDYRMRQMEKELEAREKAMKSKRPPNVVAAQKALAAVIEADKWEAEATALELQGQARPSLDCLSPDAKVVEEERMKDKQACIQRLRDIEMQMHRCKAIAEETKEAIYRGDQYVNYSNITLKSGTLSAAVKDKDVAAKKGPKTEDSGGKKSVDGPKTAEMKPASESKTNSDEDLEARINAAILRVPECGVCIACTEKTKIRKLCANRMVVRQKLVSSEVGRMRKHAQAVIEPEKKRGHKKRKLDSFAAPAPAPAPAPVPAPAKRPMIASTTVMPPPAKTKNSSKQIIQKDGQLRPRVTSNGNKRMDIPAELFPEFCRRIGAQGTGERIKLINDFADEHPAVSIRQATLRLSEITTRERPRWIPEPEKKGGRAFMFYLRPRFYSQLPMDERPIDWEAAAAEDEKKWQEEKRLKKEAKNTMNDPATSTRGSEDTGEDTEEDEDDEPPTKKAKLA